jgi:hypothetical protein
VLVEQQRAAASAALQDLEAVALATRAVDDGVETVVQADADDHGGRRRAPQSKTMFVEQGFVGAYRRVGGFGW